MTRTFKTPLSTKPSEFIQDALKDLEKANKIPRLIIDFNTSWCWGDGKVTHADFAGCVMMVRDPQAKNIQDGLHINPDWYDYHNAARLYCLSGFISGRIAESLITYRIGIPENVRNFEQEYGSRIKIPDYHSSNIDFHLKMREISQNLAEFDL